MPAMLNKLELVLYKAFATRDLGFTLHFFSRLEPFQMNSITEMAQATPINVLTAKKKNDGLTQQETADYRRVFNRALSFISNGVIKCGTVI